jgi:hypothetical protein
MTALVDDNQQNETDVSEGKLTPVPPITINSVCTVLDQTQAFTLMKRHTITIGMKQLHTMNDNIRYF